MTCRALPQLVIQETEIEIWGDRNRSLRVAPAFAEAKRQLVFNCRSRRRHPSADFLSWGAWNMGILIGRMMQAGNLLWNPWNPCTHEHSRV